MDEAGQVVSFRWLRDEARNVYSQFGEDGVIEAIFKRITPANRWCFECGAADGLFMSNTRRLIRDQGWTGILAEADPAIFRRLAWNCQDLDVHLIPERVTDLDPVLRRAGAPTDIDLAIIDVDGQDYYLFNSLMRFRPRVVVIEFAPNALDPEFIPERGGDGQAGVEAIRRLGAAKFYTEVFKNWCNLVFVAHPLDRLLEAREGSEEEPVS